MALEVREVADLDDVTRWHRVQATCMPIDHPGMVADPLESVQHAFTHPQRDERIALLLATDGDAVVANALLALPLLDNLDFSYAMLNVVPEHRRRGAGSLLATHLLALARDAQRTRVVGMVGAPLDGDAPGTAFAQGLGGSPVQEVIRRRLELADVDDAVLGDVLRTNVANRADGYEVIEWVDEVPEPLVDDAARLMAAMSTDMPMDDLEWEPERWDAARYREKELQATSRGIRRVAACAVERASGRMVAYTDVGVTLSQPALSRQWDTVVDAGHRGHRLGLVVKVANLAHLRRVSPEVTALVTSNAASNAHMVAISDLLGFRPVERLTNWQLTP